METRKNIVKHYHSNLNSKTINVSFLFYQEMYKSKLGSLLTAPILSFRIINSILSKIKDEQFSVFNIDQQSLFEDFEKTYLSQDNTYASFSFKTTDIKRNYKQIKNALLFLSQINSSNITLTNSKGERYKTFPQFLSEFTIAKREISFAVPSYWMGLMLRLDDNKKTHYNQQIQDMPLFISNVRMFLIYQWILSIGTDGTQINWLEFQKKYNYNYKSKNEFIRNVFRKLKVLMNKRATKSFNYRSKYDTVYITVFDISNAQVELKTETSHLVKAREKANYWRNRHQLDQEMYMILSKWLKNKDSYFYLEQSYKLLKINLRESNKSKTKEKKKKMSDYQGLKFFEVFQEAIKLHYKTTEYGSYVPDGYIRIYNPSTEEIYPIS